MATKALKIKTIDVQAKEWFNRTSGNSYFSAIATINFGMPTEKRVNVPFQYGYGEAYLSKTFDQLQKDGVLPNDQTIYSPSIWCRDNKIILRNSIAGSYKKKDVMNFSL